MADEADSGTEQLPLKLKTKDHHHHLSPFSLSDKDNGKITITPTVAKTSNSNYDSNDGSSPILLRCDRCDKFETCSHSLLLVHKVQCETRAALSAIAAATTTTSIPTTGGTGLSEPGSIAVNTTGTATTTAAPSSLLSTVHHNNNSTKSYTGDNNNTAGSVGSGGVDGDSETISTDIPMASTTPTENDTKQQNTNNRKLFECDVCNMKFSNGANMRRHKMRHTGVKPYECRVCQKRFFRKDHLAEHFTTHTKTLPYHCPICNRGFQRQIAMRAHFQNEHVGQHDLVKTCPLCSYRAGTMKSLRVHFFNRHGIDLDNPGPGAPSSLLLALDPQNTGQYLPQNLTAAATLTAVAAATAAGVSGGVGTSCVPACSDSGDSLRSTENATPPMHFLTPHVEISMADNVDSFNVYKKIFQFIFHHHAAIADAAVISGIPKSTTSSLEIKPTNGPNNNGTSPSSPQSADSNSNVPSSSHTTTLSSLVQSTRSNQVEGGHITPSISLIPIKQEPSNDDFSDKNNVSNSGDHLGSTGINNSSELTVPTSSLTSLIKVSPLKSLLREDLKRRICARANTRAARYLNNNPVTIANNYLNTTISNIPTTTSSAVASNIANTTSTNGLITSTGQPETELSGSIASGGGNINRHHHYNNNNNNNNNKCLQCLFCGIEFPDQTLYFLHKGCHSDSNPWKCNICGEQCNNIYEFNSHLLSKSHQ